MKSISTFTTSLLLTAAFFYFLMPSSLFTKTTSLSAKSINDCDLEVTFEPNSLDTIVGASITLFPALNTFDFNLEYTWSADPDSAMAYLLFPESLNPIVEIPDNVDSSFQVTYTLTVTQEPDCIAMGDISIQVIVPIVSNLMNVDCNEALPICAATTILEAPTLDSSIDDFALENNMDGCLSGEHASAWYLMEFSEDTPPNSVLELTLSPTAATDIDFAIWGISANCDSLGSPIRCSFAAGEGAVGLSSEAMEDSEGSSGDGFVRALMVEPGTRYYLMLDFFANPAEVDIIWGGTAVPFLLCDNSATCDSSTLAVNLEIEAEILCNGDENATILSQVSGGLSPYTFLWSNGSSSSQLSELGAGTYTVTVIDAIGCSASNTIDLISPDSLEIIVEQVNNNSDESNPNGSIQVSAIGGTAPYQYEWNQGIGNIQNPTALAAGTYTLTLTDANNCTTITTLVVDYIPPLLITNITSIHPTCEEAQNGQIQVEISGGIAPYTFDWDNGAADVQDPQNLSAGTYQLTVSDVQGQMAFGTTTLIASEEEIEVVTLRTRNIACFGEDRGSIEVAVLGNNSASYQFDWGEDLAASSSLNYLAAGDYQVTVTDEAGCTGISEVITLTQNPPLVVHTSSTPDTGQSNGTASVSVSGGVPPYAYEWLIDGAPTTPTITGLSQGVYYVVIEDRFNCFAFEEVTVGGLSLKKEVAVSQLTVSPNPSTGIFNINLNLAQEKWVEISVHNLMGQELQHLKSRHLGFYQTTIDLSGQAAGLYALKIKIGEAVISRKLLLQ